LTSSRGGDYGKIRKNDVNKCVSVGLIFADR
jgi:hypothetical protein